MAIPAVETPWLGGTLAWSVLSGPGNGTFDDTSHASAVFTPSTTGQVTLQVQDTYEGKSAKDTITFTIVACDVDILQAPSQLVAGTTAPLSCAVSPSGGTLAWSIIPSGGSATVDDPDNTSTFLTAGNTGLVYIQAAYSQGGGTAYETRPCLVIANVLPDAPTGAFVTAGYGNDTNVVNCSNVDYAVVEVALPASTKSYDTIEVKLSDGMHDAIGTVTGGETTVYAVVDCTGLSDDALALSARAYNAAGTSSATDGTDAVKDATAPDVAVTEPEDGIVVELSTVTVKGTCTDNNLETFTINGEAVPLASGAFEKAVFLASGSWGTYIEATAEDAYRNVTTVTRYVEVAPLEVQIASPADGAVLDATSVNVTGTVKGPRDAEVFVNGQRAARDGESFTLASLALSEGPNTLTAHAQTPGDSAEHVISVIRDTINPVVTIEYPSDGDMFNATSITVTGTVVEPNLASVIVKRGDIQIPAEIYGDFFVAEDVPLNTEGSNGIIVIATDAVSRTGQAQIGVTRDTTPPNVEITSPGNGSTVNKPLVTVSGTVEAGVVWLSVNGTVVEPDGESWSADVVLTTEGENTITAVARDAAGNEAEDSITVTLALPPAITVESVAFSDQCTDTELFVEITGTVSDPEAQVSAMNDAFPKEEQEGTNLEGNFTVDRVPVYAGYNILIVKATNAAGQDECEVIIEVAPETGAYETPAGGPSELQAGVLATLTVGLTPLKTEDASGEGEALAEKGGESFVTFGALAGEGTSTPGVTVELKCHTDASIAVWVATDIRFTVGGTAPRNAELVKATLSPLPDGLTLFDNGNAKENERNSLYVHKYDEFGSSAGFRGFWWDVDATAVAEWKDVNAVLTFRLPDGSELSRPTNKAHGWNDAVASLSVQSIKGGTIVESTSEPESFTVILHPDATYAEVRYTAMAALGRLADDIHWQVNGSPVAATTDGKTSVLTRTVTATAQETVVAWGDAHNRNHGADVADQGPVDNDAPDMDLECAAGGADTVQKQHGPQMLVNDTVARAGVGGEAKDADKAPDREKGKYKRQCAVRVIISIEDADTENDDAAFLGEHLYATVSLEGGHYLEEYTVRLGVHPEGRAKIEDQAVLKLLHNESVGVKMTTLAPSVKSDDVRLIGWLTSNPNPTPDGDGWNDFTVLRIRLKPQYPAPERPDDEYRATDDHGDIPLGIREASTVFITPEDRNWPVVWSTTDALLGQIMWPTKPKTQFNARGVPLRGRLVATLDTGGWEVTGSLGIHVVAPECVGEIAFLRNIALGPTFFGSVPVRPDGFTWDTRPGATWHMAAYSVFEARLYPRSVNFVYAGPIYESIKPDPDAIVSLGDGIERYDIIDSRTNGLTVGVWLPAFPRNRMMSATEHVFDVSTWFYTGEARRYCQFDTGARSTRYRGSDGKCQHSLGAATKGVWARGRWDGPFWGVSAELDERASDADPRQETATWWIEP